MKYVISIVVVFLMILVWTKVVYIGVPKKLPSEVMSVDLESPTGKKVCEGLSDFIIPVCKKYMVEFAQDPPIRVIQEDQNNKIVGGRFFFHDGYESEVVTNGMASTWI